MKKINFMADLHKSTKRDYLARVNDIDYPKAKAAQLAKKFDFDYWDGDRRICYGGYKYMEGRWENVARKMADYYKLNSNSRVLDIGCGKGYLMYDFTKILPGIEVYGLDISNYAVKNCKEELKGKIVIGKASELPWPKDYFDLVISINTLHCLHSFDLFPALKEIERVSKKNKTFCKIFVFNFMM